MNIPVVGIASYQSEEYPSLFKIQRDPKGSLGSKAFSQMSKNPSIEKDFLKIKLIQGNYLTNVSFVLLVFISFICLFSIIISIVLFFTIQQETLRYSLVAVFIFLAAICSLIWIIFLFNLKARSTEYNQLLVPYKRIVEQPSITSTSLTTRTTTPTTTTLTEPVFTKPITTEVTEPVTTTPTTTTLTETATIATLL